LPRSLSSMMRWRLLSCSGCPLSASTMSEVENADVVGANSDFGSSWPSSSARVVSEFVRKRR
jgi:hypothetical protein